MRLLAGRVVGGLARSVDARGVRLAALAAWLSPPCGRDANTLRPFVIRANEIGPTEPRVAPNAKTPPACLASMCSCRHACARRWPTVGRRDFPRQGPGVCRPVREACEP